METKKNILINEFEKILTLKHITIISKFSPWPIPGAAYLLISMNRESIMFFVSSLNDGKGYL